MSHENLASDRMVAIHFAGQSVDELSTLFGTPAEWLGTAIGHLKAQMSNHERRDGFVTVSFAALSLLMQRFEEIEHGGEPWKGNAG